VIVVDRDQVVVVDVANHNDESFLSSMLTTSSLDVLWQLSPLMCFYYKSAVSSSLIHVVTRLHIEELLNLVRCPSFELTFTSTNSMLFQQVSVMDVQEVSPNRCWRVQYIILIVCGSLPMPRPSYFAFVLVSVNDGSSKLAFSSSSRGRSRYA
jgi:hypothetical protein